MNEIYHSMFGYGEGCNVLNPSALQIRIVLMELHVASHSPPIAYEQNANHSIHTVWNLNAINGRTKSNQLVIFLPTNSGRITSSELPMLRTIISELHVWEWELVVNRKNDIRLINKMRIMCYIFRSSIKCEIHFWIFEGQYPPWNGYAGRG